eukprot:CAMPEP_0203686884 /NCGR_PEP_ID=MMETSP0090-20130426/49294_1 /ASSEMBLY_ACC=CAM_ASM_001088 /TAXON_ID=426623 /ORGANISM="Chaetoceros affinis, Strain CCMP159" /LENGTH=314 /DNA_ID=CAMNT_0050556129 /DNA_START=92 /DNA_END=1036 /DNA_ORIENTATION=-
MTYDDPVFSITSSPTINGNILQCPLSACIIADTPENLSHKLAKERDLGCDSYYAPYIDVLPPLESKDGRYIGPLSSMPRFWNTERIEFVSAADGGQMERKLNEDERKDLDPWAWACVSSRANYVLGHGFAMTPILDMINHDSSVSTSAKIIDDNLHLSIDDKFSIGDEIFISYGDLTNLETLCNYGFVSNDNKCNFESIDIFMMRKPPCKVTISGMDGSIDQGSLATLRSYLATPTELENASNSFFMTPISDSNEEEVYCLIASFLDEAITDASEGADKIQGEDDLVETYLRKRAETLQKALQNIKKKFPLLEY